MGEFDYDNQQKIDEKFDRTYSRPVGAVYPTFFVGVGGCGSEIVQHIQTMLSKRPDFKDRYEKLVQFIAIDTNMVDLDALSLKYKFLISDFPKGEYVNVKMGREYKEPDPFFQQWWPDWYASRPDSTKGAGQIRVESRLSLAYQLEDDRGGIIEQFNDAVTRTKDHDNPYRVKRPPLAYCHIFGSVAGGTGSGGFLNLAYLFQDLLKTHQLNPITIGHFVLPTLFYRKVRQRLHNDICSNGYAALKELEWFMTLGYNNNPRMARGIFDSAQDDYIEFNYNANAKPEKGNQRVTAPPFQLVNIIDEPGDFSFASPKEIYPAIAGCAYVQLFSPILGQRESEEDNYYKKIKHLENGFSLNYGTYGLSMLVLPDDPILRFCEDKMIAGLIDCVTGAGEEMDDTAFLNQLLDTARVEIESSRENRGVLKLSTTMKTLIEAGILKDEFQGTPQWEPLSTGWPEAVSALKNGLFDRIKAEVEKVSGKLEQEIKRGLNSIPSLSDKIVPFKADGKAASGERMIDAVEKELKRVLEKAESDMLARSGERNSALQEALTKAIDGCEVDGQKPSPMAIRVAMIYATKWLSDQADDSGLRDGERIFPAQTAFRQHQDEILEKWHIRIQDRFGKDDWADFRDRELISYWTDEKNRSATPLTKKFQASLYIAAGKWLVEQQGEFGKTKDALRTVSSNLKAEMKKTLKEKDSVRNNAVLEVEVFHGVRTRKRHWDRLFNWLVKVKSPLIAGKDEFTEIGFLCQETATGEKIVVPDLRTAMMLQSEFLETYRQLFHEFNRNRQSSANPKEPTPTRLIEALEKRARTFCRRRLTGLIKGRRNAGDNRLDKGLLMDECLELEARWELEEIFIRDNLANYLPSSTNDLTLMTAAEEMRIRTRLINEFEPTDADVLEYINEKIRFVADKSRVLSKVRLTETNAVDPFRFVCLHEKHYQEETGNLSMDTTKSLGTIIKDAHQDYRTARFLKGWVDEKRIAFFNAQAGLPIHNFDPVNKDLKNAYELVYREYVTGHDRTREPLMDFPSHIDKSFEKPHNWDPHTVLPDLEPGRDLGRSRHGLDDFMKLVIYGIVREYTLGEDAEMEKKLSFVNSLDGACKSMHVESETPVKVWIIDGKTPQRPRSADPVLYEALPPFIEILGDRLDRAFDRWDSVFLRKSSNQHREKHVQQLVDEKDLYFARKEDPAEFNQLLEDLLSRLREEREEARGKLERNFRVRTYLSVLDQGIASVKAMYVQSKATTDN